MKKRKLVSTNGTEITALQPETEQDLAEVEERSKTGLIDVGLDEDFSPVDDGVIEPDE